MRLETQCLFKMPVMDHIFIPHSPILKKDPKSFISEMTIYIPYIAGMVRWGKGSGNNASYKDNTQLMHFNISVNKLIIFHSSSQNVHSNLNVSSYKMFKLFPPLMNSLSVSNIRIATLTKSFKVCTYFAS